MIQQLKTPFAAALCAAFLLPGVSTAAIIFTNLGTSPVYDTTSGDFVGNDFAGDNAAEGDTFSPLTTATFGSLDIALSCAISSCPDQYAVSLNQDSGSDSPGAVIESFTGSGLLLGQLGVNNPLTVFTSVLKPVLAAGTQYWVTVSTDLNNSIVFNFNSTGDTSDQAISTDGGATYFSPSGLTPGAYQVNSLAASTPEPATIALMAGALGLLGLATRRKSVV